MIADEGVSAWWRIVQSECHDARGRVTERAWQNGQAGTSSTKLGLHLTVVAAAGDGGVRQYPLEPDRVGHPGERSVHRDDPQPCSIAELEPRRAPGRSIDRIVDVHQAAGYDFRFVERPDTEHQVRLAPRQAV